MFPSTVCEIASTAHLAISGILEAVVASVVPEHGTSAEFAPGLTHSSLSIVDLLREFAMKTPASIWVRFDRR